MSTIEKIAKNSGSVSFQKLNPELFGKGANFKITEIYKEQPKSDAPKKRIRQSSKPVMNKLETEWNNELLHRGIKARAQSVTLKLANGVKLTPDFTVLDAAKSRTLSPTAWEVKGPHAWEDSLIKLKFAAKEYPEIQFILVWKDKHTSRWVEQEILP